MIVASFIVIRHKSNAHGTDDLSTENEKIEFMLLVNGAIPVSCKREMLTNSANLRSPGTVLMYPVFNINVDVVLLDVTVRVIVTECDIVVCDWGECLVVIEFYLDVVRCVRVCDFAKQI